MCSKSSSHSRGAFSGGNVSLRGHVVRSGISEEVLPQPTGDLDLNGVCPEELDIGVAVERREVWREITSHVCMEKKDAPNICVWG